ncbi:UDP-2-acetamido-2-deoxy-3-oxo-D-glucuronate aminotransferase [Clostridium tepidiprofundi DSM 19306]|uniref:UDP-2-acetamido-2-deoxy-3-oxo-D-glucuronate aminotransferase n=1 Tax=Clostridium tepidiprofundi DSM 19306 TaxID=1121338 RepID=A0A151B5G2_9CLOT|nr:DegT/DnrJ/EryC1/StrS family aminotransferase [Clostridium tepidiprofundi]KYH35148.1 UDP-2-acetamido-2-deoxy-3-oxo-D-glucuronate aminotransferase [Clostridium tepidiprofundi DSM 19306]
MKINLLDLKAQYRTIENEINEAIKEVLETTHFIMGPNVKELEKEIAAFTETKHGISVASGTDALMLTLKAMGIGYGDEVITTPFTFFASAETTSVLGAKPVFADIEEDTLCIDTNSIEKLITEKTKAIIPVHIFGNMCDMDRIMEIADKHNLYVIEDACQAIGAEYKGRKAGSIGHVGCFSFYPTKNLGAYGDGGMIVTNDDELAEKIKLIRVHGSKKKYNHEAIGYNSRLDEIQAAILRVKFRYINKWNDARYEKAHIYNELLKDLDDIVLPTERENSKHVYHLYTIQSKYRDEIVDYLKKNDIATGIYYPVPVHLQDVYKHLNYKKGDLPKAEEACTKTFAIPLYPEINYEQQKYVCDKIKEFFL